MLIITENCSLKKSSESVADEALVMNLVESARKELLKAAETAQHIRDKYSTNTCMYSRLIRTGIFLT